MSYHRKPPPLPAHLVDKARGASFMQAFQSLDLRLKKNGPMSLPALSSLRRDRSVQRQYEKARVVLPGLRRQGRRRSVAADARARARIPGRG